MDTNKLNQIKYPVYLQVVPRNHTHKHSMLLLWLDNDAQDFYLETVLRGRLIELKLYIHSELN